MITSVFRKSTPLNFALVVLLMLVFFSLYHLQAHPAAIAVLEWVKIGALFLVLIGSIFLTDFIAKRNGLSKDSTYTVFFYFLFLLFFPDVLNNTNLIVSNFFLLLALRRLISLQSLKASKEKIFDASLWIFIAALFHFWNILYIVLVFISILFHVARDYRNWILPFIAFVVSVILFLLFGTVFNFDLVNYLINSVQVDFALDYFTNNYQNGALSLYATVVLFFVVSMLATLSNRPQLLHTSYKKIVAALFIGILVYVLSANKSNDILIFTMAPLAIMASSHIEIPQEKLKQELVFGVLILCSLFAFFSQL